MQPFGVIKMKIQIRNAVKIYLFSKYDYKWIPYIENSTV